MDNYNNIEVHIPENDNTGNNNSEYNQNFNIASKTKRLLSYIIDTIIIFVILVFVYFFLFANLTVFISDDLLFEIENIETMTEEEMMKFLFQPEILFVLFLLMVVTYLILFVYNVVYAKIFNGQTIGRQIIGIKIVREFNDGHIENISFTRLFYREMIIIFIMLMIFDGLLFFVSSLFTFRENKKALHDSLSKTRVIEK